MCVFGLISEGLRACLYVCVHMSVLNFLYIYIYVCVCVCVSVSLSVCLLIPAYMCFGLCVRVRVCVCVSVLFCIALVFPVSVSVLPILPFACLPAYLRVRPFLCLQ